MSALDERRVPAEPLVSPSELRADFHRLNNQLGIILAHAELLEAKTVDGVCRARAAQIVASALDAMATIRDMRDQLVLPSFAAQ